MTLVGYGRRNSIHTDGLRGAWSDSNRRVGDRTSIKDLHNPILRRGNINRNIGSHRLLIHFHSFSRSTTKVVVGVWRQSAKS